MTTKHKMRATIPCGHPEEGAEVEVEIAFTFRPAEIDFTGVKPIIDGKPGLYSGAFADMQMESLGELAADWLESDEGITAATDVAEYDAEIDREFPGLRKQP